MTSISLSADSAKNASTSAAPGIHDSTVETAETAGNEAGELASSFDAHLAADQGDADDQGDQGDQALTPGQAALRALGFENPGTRPTKETPLADVLLYALSRSGGEHPEQGMVLSVASELESLAMFIDGPLSISLEMMARRLRASMDLAKRLREAAPSA
jgi:hypothetical protein